MRGHPLEGGHAGPPAPFLPLTSCAARRPLVALALALLLAGPAGAAKVGYGDVEVAVDSDPHGEPSHGYTEWRVQVANRGDRPRRVTLELPGNTDFGPRSSAGLRSIRRTVEVGPGKLAVVSLFQPATPAVTGHDLAVYLDGSKQEALVPLRPASSPAAPFVHGRRAIHRGHFGFGGRPTSEQLVLMSQRVQEKFFQVPGLRGGMGPAGAALPEPAPAPGDPAAPPPLPPPGGAGAPPGAMGGPAAGGVFGAAPAVIHAFDGQFLRADTPVSLWSTRWLAFTRYDLVTLTREDLDELERGTPEVKAVLAALWQYVEAGGAMLVLGPGEVKVPAAWAGSRGQQDGLSVYRVGFGLCLVAPDRDRQKWSSDRWSAIASASSGTGTPWKSSRSLIDLNTSFPAVDDVGVPVRGLFGLMILFGIAIGPVNLAVLSRRNKRIWLLWTVPALSAVFCLAVLGYMIVAEGWTGHARVAGFTLLDEADRHATTLGKTAFYSPMTPGDGVRFSDDTEVMPQGNEHPAYTSNCGVVWKDGEQHLTHGWVTARVPAHFTMRKCELRRERIALRKDGGQLAVVNGLGADVRSLTLADAKGEVFTAGPIAAGGTATLTKANKPARRGRPTELWRRVYTGMDWARAIDDAVKKPEDLLGPGTYLAVVEESPFLEQGLKGASVRPAPSVVLGIMAAEK